MSKYTSLAALGVAITLALLGSPPARAYPTLEGPTGLLIMPTAGTVPAGLSEVELTYADFEDLTEFPVLNYLYGGPKFEVGAGWLRWDPDVGDTENGYNLHAKYAWLPETETAPGLSLGLSFQDISNVGSKFSIYVAGSKLLTRQVEEREGAFLGHVTLGWESWEPDAAGAASEDDFVANLGLEYRMTLVNGNALSIFAEYEFDNDVRGESIWAVGVRYQFTPQISAQAGAGQDGLWFIGVRYTLALGE